MVEIKRGHDAAESSGKQLHHIAEYTEERPGPGPDRQVIDVVTEDGKMYRFSQFSPNEPWSFEPGPKHSNRAGKHGRLPGNVRDVIEAEAEDVATEWGDGYSY